MNLKQQLYNQTALIVSEITGVALEDFAHKKKGVYKRNSTMCSATRVLFHILHRKGFDYTDIQRISGFNYDTVWGYVNSKNLTKMDAEILECCEKELYRKFAI